MIRKKEVDGEMKKISIAEQNPPILLQWNHARNRELGIYPEETAPKSNKKVWWICEKGHEWVSAVNNRAAGNGCPVCAGQKVLAGYNDLATKASFLASEWNYEKNGTLTPSDILPQSNRKVWWKCARGHEWESTVANRTLGNKCPYCSGKKVLAGYNDLATLNPELASEWHPTKNGDLKPSDVRPHMAKKVWWRCPRGHEWQATVDSRSSGRGCPSCNPQTSFAEQAVFYYVHQAIDDAVSRDSRTGIEFDIYIPSIKCAIEYDGYHWHKDPKKTALDLDKTDLCIKQGIRLIRIREHGLPAVPDCINIFRRDKKSFSSLEQAIREVLSLLYRNDIDVDIEKDQSEIAAGLFIGKKENSLQIKSPEIAKQWHATKNGNLLPDTVPCGSSYYAWWVCENGHEWQAKVNLRTGNKSGCPVCDNIRRTAPSVRHEQSLYRWCIDNRKEQLLSEYSEDNPWSSREISPHSGYKVLWRCGQGHVWEASVTSRVNGSGCPYCSGRSAIPGVNDLKAVRPDLAAEWNFEKNKPLLPTEVKLQSNKKVWWVCKKGHEWQAAVCYRSRSNKCPYCSNKVVLEGDNDLGTLYPSLAAEWHPSKNERLLPSQVTAGSGRKVWWICEKGHEWQATIAGRVKGSKCPYCSRRYAIVGVNDLETVMPMLAAEWHPSKNGDLKPSDVTVGSEKKVWWTCSEGHEWQAFIHNRTRGNGCPVCYRTRRRKTRNKQEE